MLMKLEAGPQLGCREALAHGTMVGVRVVAHIANEWLDVGEEFTGMVVGSQSLLPDTIGTYNVIPDQPLPLDKDSEYRDKGPRLVSQDESIWQPLNDRYTVETRRIIVPIVAHMLELPQPGQEIILPELISA